MSFCALPETVEGTTIRCSKIKPRPSMQFRCLQFMENLLFGIFSIGVSAGK